MIILLISILYTCMQPKRARNRKKHVILPPPRNVLFRPLTFRIFCFRFRVRRVGLREILVKVRVRMWFFKKKKKCFKWTSRSCVCVVLGLVGFNYNHRSCQKSGHITGGLVWTSIGHGSINPRVSGICVYLLICMFMKNERIGSWDCLETLFCSFSSNICEIIDFASYGLHILVPVLLNHNNFR